MALFELYVYMNNNMRIYVRMNVCMKMKWFDKKIWFAIKNFGIHLFTYLFTYFYF